MEPVNFALHVVRRKVAVDVRRHSPVPVTQHLLDDMHRYSQLHEEAGRRVAQAESADLELLCAIGAAIVEYGRVLTAYFEHVGFPPETNSVAKLVAAFTKSYQGAYDSLVDWAQDYFDDAGLLQQVPESLRGYIDLESWVDDAELNGDIFAVEFEEKVHVFIE